MESLMVFPPATNTTTTAAHIAISTRYSDANASVPAAMKQATSSPTAPMTAFPILNI